MIHHFDCPPLSGNPKAQSLIFDWDDETGEFFGRDAQKMRDLFTSGNTNWRLHPMPGVRYKLTNPKSRADIAAVIGLMNHLPPELKDDYPKVRIGWKDWDGCLYDDNGNVVAKALF